MAELRQLLDRQQAQWWTNLGRIDYTNDNSF